MVGVDDVRSQLPSPPTPIPDIALCIASASTQKSHAITGQDRASTSKRRVCNKLMYRNDGSGGMLQKG